MFKRKVVKGTQDKLEEIVLKTNSAMNVFTSAIKDLEDANAEFEVLSEQLRQEIIHAESKRDVIMDNVEANTNVIDNMKKLLGR